MIPTIKMQRIDGVLTFKLPPGITNKEFVDWLNKAPDRKRLRVQEISERWTVNDPLENES